MDFEDGLPRGNYDGFLSGFITDFQVLTMENWQTVLFDSMRAPVSKYFTAFFYVVWIFLGNFILLNLFLAILLDSFLGEDEEEEDDEIALRKKKVKKMEKAKKRQAIIDNQRVFMSHLFYKAEGAHQASKKYLGQLKADSEEDLEDLDEDQIVKIFKQ